MTNGLDLLVMIDKAVKPYPNPAVFLSGGLDSTIVLHHLAHQTKEPIHTYTAYWNHNKDETKYAKAVAEHYDTIHHNVEIKHIFKQFQKLLPKLDKPRINLWTSLLFEAAVKDGCETIYIGEGSDEHFDGYWYKPPVTPQESWHGLLEYSLPTYRQLAEIYGVRLETPLVYLDLRITLPYRDIKNHDKTFLRLIYQDQLPKTVINRRKQPGRVPWLDLWEQEAAPYILGEKPSTRPEAHQLINKWAYKEWLKKR